MKKEATIDSTLGDGTDPDTFPKLERALSRLPMYGSRRDLVRAALEARPARGFGWRWGWAGAAAALAVLVGLGVARFKAPPAVVEAEAAPWADMVTLRDDIRQAEDHMRWLRDGDYSLRFSLPDPEPGKAATVDEQIYDVRRRLDTLKARWELDSSEPGDTTEIKQERIMV